jgi:acyl carrier protein
MTEDEIFVKLTRVFREVLDRPDMVLAKDTAADSVEGWDSLMNVRLFVAAEVEFNTRFDTAEISSLRNVGDLVRLIGSKV